MSSKKAPSGDERFARVKKDPRFWEMPDLEQKVHIDKRFQSMFHDQRFKLKYTVDKRGRPVNHTSTEDLKRFYKLSDSEPSEGDDDDEEERTKKTVKEKPSVQEEAQAGFKQTKAEQLGDLTDSEEEEEEDDDEEYSYSKKEAPLSADEGEEEEESESEEDGDSGPDLARGKGNIETSSEDEEEDEEQQDHLRQEEEEEIEHDWGEMWKDAPRREEVTRRLAVCNMNWDRMKATDLLALLTSFKPKEGVVLSVTIYPSEFGKERMKAEQTHGPLELTSLPDDPEADTEEQRVYREKVRDYQFKRLRYYYAVVECDSDETAAKIYEECDGFEYESSCSTLDLRFIPDGMTFEDEPRDRASDVDLSSYKPKLFTSTATTTAKVELTWDETDHDRISALNRNFSKDELLEMDFNAYLASSSEEEEEERVEEEVRPVDEKKGGTAGEKKKKKEEEEEQQITKYRQLLQSIQEKDRKQKDKAMEMEVTWVPGLKEKAEKLVRKKLEGKEKLTPWEEFLQKKKEKLKEKRKGKKEEAESEVAISDDELPPDVDLHDPFFSEETAGSSKKPKQIRAGLKRLRAEEEELESEKQKAEMALLMDDDDGDEEHQHFNYDKIVEQQNLSKKKRKKLLKSNQLLQEDKFEVDVKDSRFQAMFTSHLYNLDPSDPAYKTTKATRTIIEEKQRRREERQRSQQEALQSQPVSGETTDPGLSLLVKSVKNKTEQFLARKKQRTK